MAEKVTMTPENLDRAFRVEVFWFQQVSEWDLLQLELGLHLLLRLHNSRPRSLLKQFLFMESTKQGLILPFSLNCVFRDGT